jgi:glutamine synthetase
MGDVSALLNPFVNSYKRLDPSLFVATRASWATDNRNAACRLILNVSPKAARVENRRPGADANPYLVTAAMLAGGLHGLRHSIDPGPRLVPGDDLATAGGALPSDLREAIERFDRSPLVREFFGAPFVEAFLATRKAEQRAFDEWWRGSVSEWELARYPEHI